MDKKIEFEKYELNGKIAVLISNNFGAGWSTWYEEYAEYLLFAKELVEFVLKNEKDKIEEFLTDKFGDHNIYLGGLRDLKVEWIEKGTSFYVHEYDGSESIVTNENLYITA